MRDWYWGLGPFNQYQVTQIDQVSLPPIVKHVLAPQDDFGRQKNLVNKQTSQELPMLSTVTLNCQVTKNVMNSSSQLPEL